MSDYWEDTQEDKDKGIDYDLRACLFHNPQPNLTHQDIQKVLAVHTGENDGEDWHWVLALTNGKFAYLRGGCDYTGWDCRSWASSVIVDSLENVLDNPHELSISETNNPIMLGLGRMLSALSGEYGKTDETIFEELKQQLIKGKSETWTEKTDKDMPQVPYVEP